MARRKQIRTLSKLTRDLLAEGESEHVDFKRTPDGVSSEDLVAFANTDTGGQILVGVDEKNVGGAEVGVVCGCDVSDGGVLKILNKAVACVPSVSVAIFVENLNSKPILRVEVPSSTTRPHCTPKGIYCRRDGSRNRPLQPQELLGIFLDIEARAFAERFESTAGRIASDLASLEVSLESSIQNMASQLGWAEDQLGDTEGLLSAIVAIVRRVESENHDISCRLRELFRQDERDDPILIRERGELLEQLVKEIREKPDLPDDLAEVGKLEVSLSGKAARELTHAEAQEVLEEAISLLRECGAIEDE